MLGGLLYFLFNFLFASTDIILALLACVTICVTFFVVNWLNSKLSDAKLGDAKKNNECRDVQHRFVRTKDLSSLFVSVYFVGKWIGRIFGQRRNRIIYRVDSAVVTVLVQGLRMESSVAMLHNKHETLKKNNA